MKNVQRYTWILLRGNNSEMTYIHKIKHYREIIQKVNVSIKVSFSNKLISPCNMT